MKGSMTAGSELKHIVLFAIPIIVGNLLQQLYNTVDSVVVGNYVNESALAAVGSCATLAFAFLAVAMGLGIGASIMTSQYFGANKVDDMRRGSCSALIMTLCVGTVLSVAGVAFARPLCATVMGITDETILDMATEYFAIFSVGIVFQFLYNCVSAILRGVGDSKASLYFLLASTILNIVLDLLLVVVIPWGVAGVAIATVVAEILCTVFSIVYMLKKYPAFRFKRDEIRLDREKSLICLKLGIPSIIQYIAISLGNLGLQRLVNTFGQATMSAYAVGSRVDGYAQMTVVGMTSATASFTGQNIGAGNITRVKRGFRAALGICLIISSVIAAAAFVSAPFLSKLFGVSGDSLSKSVEMIRFLSPMLLVFAVYQIPSGVLQGSGDTFFSAAFALSSIIMKLAAAYLLVYVFNAGYASPWLSTPCGWALGTALTYVRYFSGRWQKQAIVKIEEAEPVRKLN
ncbi:MAG: MATE family efflux transporter [Peptococcaceae bacterium]|jgi:putative MATE family efflux protein|nr:MATE family efflux transporter [Peptococcaceae bacterium]